MASSASLSSKLASLRNDLKNKKARRQTAQTVLDNLKTKYDDDVTDFNKYLGKVTMGLDGGLYGNTTVTSNHDCVDSYKQKGDTSDTNLSSAEDSLQIEINALDTAISDVETEISKTETEYNNAVKAEKAAAAEAKRKQEEAARQAAQQKASSSSTKSTSSSSTKSLSSGKSSSSSNKSSSQKSSSSSSKRKSGWDWWPF